MMMIKFQSIFKHQLASALQINGSTSYFEAFLNLNLPGLIPTDDIFSLIAAFASSDPDSTISVRSAYDSSKKQAL